MKVLRYFNLQTLIALIISQAAAFFAIHFNIRFNVNLILFSLAVVFPLHFSIQAAFKRRERALEYFSSFKGWIMALYYSIHLAEDLTDEKKKEATNILKAVADQLSRQLESREYGYGSIQRKLDDVFAFMQANREELSKRNLIKMIRYLGDVTESSVYLMSLAKHRTMAGLRFYSVFFIIIFPLVQAPILLDRLDGIIPETGLYLVVACTTLILITLNNFQYVIEYPFDQRGMDNVQLKEFKLDI
jgi:hypothetical protein